MEGRKDPLGLGSEEVRVPLSSTGASPCHGFISLRGYQSYKEVV